MDCCVVRRLQTYRFIDVFRTRNTRGVTDETNSNSDWCNTRALGRNRWSDECADPLGDTGSSGTTSQRPANSSEPTTTVIGCLQQGAGMPGASGASSASAPTSSPGTGTTPGASTGAAGTSASSFVLTNATMRDGASAGPAGATGNTGTTGTTGTTGHTGSATSGLGATTRVMLMPGGSITPQQLQQHLNHQIEVQGQLTTMEHASVHASLLQRIEDGQIDPSFVVTHRLRLDEAPGAYSTFLHKEDNCMKVVLRP